MKEFDPSTCKKGFDICGMLGDLKNKCFKAHLFVLALNIDEDLDNESLVLMLKSLEEAFSVGFWNHFAIAFTCWSTSSRAIKKRKEERKLSG